MTSQPDQQSTSQKKQINPTLKLGLEIGPIILFILSYNFGDRLIDVFNLGEPFTKPIFLSSSLLIGLL